MSGSGRLALIGARLEFLASFASDAAGRQTQCLLDLFLFLKLLPEGFDTENLEGHKTQSGGVDSTSVVMGYARPRLGAARDAQPGMASLTPPLACVLRVRWPVMVRFVRPWRRHAVLSPGFALSSLCIPIHKRPALFRPLGVSEVTIRFCFGHADAETEDQE